MHFHINTLLHSTNFSFIHPIRTLESSSKLPLVSYGQNLYNAFKIKICSSFLTCITHHLTLSGIFCALLSYPLTQTQCHSTTQTSEQPQQTKSAHTSPLKNKIPIPTQHKTLNLRSYQNHPFTLNKSNKNLNFLKSPSLSLSLILPLSNSLTHILPTLSLQWNLSPSIATFHH